MTRIILLFAITTLSVNAYCQRYFEFHFPPKTAGADPYPGLPGEEFIVKMTDTSLFWKMDEDLLLHDSLKYWRITGWIRPAVEGYNKPWRWEYNADTLMFLENGQYGGCNRLPSYIDKNLEQWMAAWGGWTCPWFSVVKREVFPTSIVIETGAKKHSITLYPNPVVDIAFIEISAEIMDALELFIFSAEGRQIVERTVTGGDKIVLKRTDFPSPGTYTYYLKGKKARYGSGKFIIH